MNHRRSKKSLIFHAFNSKIVCSQIASNSSFCKSIPSQRYPHENIPDCFMVLSFNMRKIYLCFYFSKWFDGWGDLSAHASLLEVNLSGNVSQWHVTLIKNEPSLFSRSMLHYRIRDILISLLTSSLLQSAAQVIWNNFQSSRNFPECIIWAMF